MNRNSLRSRVTTFYVCMLAIALVVFSGAVYFGVKNFLTRSLERSLTLSANSITTDFLRPLDSKGESWFLSEISESYPQGVSDTFVRVWAGTRVLYETGSLREPVVDTSTLPHTIDMVQINKIQKIRLPGGQQMLLYTLSYRSQKNVDYVIETGASTAPIEHILRSLFLILLTTTPVIILVAAIGGYLLMSGPLRPMVTLTKQAERVGRADLGERLPVIRTGDELERLSLALNRMIERLEETVAHNMRFSADASHELRTPLTIIRGELEMLVEAPLLQATVLDCAGSALEECNRMANIVDSLMAISRLEGGGERMKMATVDLVAITQSTLDHMSLLAEEKGIAVRFTGTGAVLVAGDEMRLRQVIVNLVDNAIKYTTQNGSVSVAVSAAGGVASLTVSDTGIGIPANALPFIFERFYRADDVRSRSSGGTGLGLAIVKSICAAHRGTIAATSVEGQGSTLRMELPLLTQPMITEESQGAPNSGRHTRGRPASNDVYGRRDETENLSQPSLTK